VVNEKLHSQNISNQGPATTRKLRISNIAKLLGRVFLLVVLLEVGWLFLANILVKPVVAKWGAIEKGCWVEAIYLRNETILTASVSGSLVTRVEDGTKVPRGEILASINSGDSLPETNTAWETDSAVQEKLLSLEKEEQSLQADLNRVQVEVESRRSKFKKAPIQSIKVKEKSEDLLSLQKEKAQIMRSIQTVRSQKSEWQKKSLDQPDKPEFIIAGEPGYVFNQYDNQEGKLTPGQFQELSEGDFQQNYPLKSPDTTVKAGENIGKIVDAFGQIIAVIVNTRQTGVPNQGDNWWIKTADHTYQVPVNCTLPLKNGKMVIGLEDNTLAPDFLSNRRSKIFIVYKRVVGVCIPVQAVFRQGNDTLVKVVKGDGFQQKRVQVLETDGDKAIVTGIDFGTTLISR
jgi:putative membrane fusion protein